jgi:DNA-binding NtrC family response regulator
VEPAELLLVDDDADATELLADALTAAGYRIRVARDGKEGLARLDEAFPDMVVLDVEMPTVNGPEMAIRMFVEDLGQEEIPILLCSGILNLSDIAEQVGTPYFLAKPYTLETMLKLVAQILAERRQPTPHLVASSG